jgi:hypothetical protein
MTHKILYAIAGLVFILVLIALHFAYQDENDRAVAKQYAQKTSVCSKYLEPLTPLEKIQKATKEVMGTYDRPTFTECMNN